MVIKAKLIRSPFTKDSSIRKREKTEILKVAQLAPSITRL